MKYLVTVVQGITVTADSPKEAEAQGLAMRDGGFAETIAVEVEPLGLTLGLGERKPPE